MTELRDNTVDIFAEWFMAQGCTIESKTVLRVGDKFMSLTSLANFLEIKEAEGLRFTVPSNEQLATEGKE